MRSHPIPPPTRLCPPIPFCTPKGRNSSAQGNALGERATQHLFSPEGAKLAASDALSGLFAVCIAKPRASPWAVEFEPFGLDCPNCRAKPRRRREGQSPFG